jgi:geranylgeranyl diphosphate synthase type 3
MENITASFEYTRGVLRTLDRQIRDEIDRLGGNPKLMELMDMLKVPEAVEKGRASS